jgi:hypothetical protein
MTEPERGVFGQLPRRRPAVRSPRRDRRLIEEDWDGDEPYAGEGHDPEAARGRLESLTLAGVDAAADVAVLGLKVIGRLYEGVRGAAGRH